MCIRDSLIGFAAISYLSVPMLGIALFGLALAVITFKNDQKQAAHPAAAESTGGMMDDEL